MKRLTYILILIITGAILVPILWSQSEAKTNVTSPPDDGLIGHWPLQRNDLISSTVTADRSRYSNNGTLVNSPTITSPGPNGRGQATNFYAPSQQRIDLPNESFFEGRSALTVSAWINATSTTSHKAIVDKLYDETNYSWSLKILDNYAYFNLATDTTNTMSGPYSNNPISTNTWYHLVGSWSSSSGQIKMYVNGSFQNSVAKSGNTVRANNNPVYIGSSWVVGGGGVSYFFWGAIADVRIYDKELTQAEVTRLYNAYRPKVSTGSLNKGLVGHWTLDSTSSISSTVTADKTPYNNHATSSGSPTLGGAADQHGQANKATTFDGVDDYIDTNSTILNFNSRDFTVSAWFKNNNPDALNRVIVGNRNSISSSAGSRGWNLIIAAVTREVRFYADDGTMFIALGGNIDVGTTWHHVVVTIDDGGTSRFHFDGIETQTTTVIANYNMENGNNVVIGAQPNGNAKIDANLNDIKIWNRALLPAEVSQLYNSYRPKISTSSLNKGLIGHWPLAQSDLKSSTLIADKTPYGNHGTLVNSPAFTTDYHGQPNRAMSFDGSSQYINIGEGKDVLDGMSNLTLSAWAYWYDASYYNPIISKWGASNFSFWLGIESNETLHLEIKDNHDHKGSIDSSSALSTNQWHHVAIVFSPGVAQMYVDGKNMNVVVNDSFSDVEDVRNTTYDVLIGMYLSESTPHYWASKLADVRVFNRALSAEEVRALYELYRP